MSLSGCDPNLKTRYLLNYLMAGRQHSSSFHATTACNVAGSKDGMSLFFNESLDEAFSVAMWRFSISADT